MRFALNECYRNFYELNHSKITFSDISWAMLRCCVFRVFLIVYLLTTIKYTYLVNADTWYVTSYIFKYLAFITDPSLGRLRLLVKVKRSKIVLAYPFIWVLYIKYNIERMSTVVFTLMYTTSMEVYAGIVLVCFSSPDNSHLSDGGSVRTETCWRM
jgi:hypothetical protein